MAVKVLFEGYYRVSISAFLTMVNNLKRDKTCLPDVLEFFFFFTLVVKKNFFFNTFTSFRKGWVGVRGFLKLFRTKILMKQCA